MIGIEPSVMPTIPLPPPSYPLPKRKSGIEDAASRVKLAMVVNETVRELYGTTELVLDEQATLRRVALFYRGSGRSILTPEERRSALNVLRERADAYVADHEGIWGYSPSP